MIFGDLSNEARTTIITLATITNKVLTLNLALKVKKKKTLHTPVECIKKG